MVIPFDIRWCSLYTSIIRIIDVYGALADALFEIYEEESDPAANGYYLKLINFTFVYQICILSDVLFPLFQIDKSLQETGGNILKGLKKIADEKDKLSNLYESDQYGYQFGSFLKEYNKSRTFKSVPIKSECRTEEEMLNFGKSIKQFVMGKLEERFKLIEHLEVFGVLDFYEMSKSSQFWKEKVLDY